MSAAGDGSGGGGDSGVSRRHVTGSYLRLDDLAAQVKPHPVLQLVLRLVWFVVAGSVGALWIYSEQYTGSQLPVHAHLVFGSLFIVAIASGGYDLRDFILWRRELARLGTDLDLTPKNAQDATILLRAILEKNPEAMSTIRKELDRCPPPLNPSP